MNAPNTEQIEERLKVFDERFSALTARYEEFAKTLQRLNERIDEHLVVGEEFLKVARDEQEEANKPKGIKGWFHRRNQGRINAKLMGAIERDFAILKDIEDQTTQNLELITDTGRAVKRDLHEMMEAVVENLQSFQDGTTQSLRILSDDVELLKQLASKQMFSASATGTESDSPSDQS